MLQNSKWITFLLYDWKTVVLYVFSFLSTETNLFNPFKFIKMKFNIKIKLYTFYCLNTRNLSMINLGRGGLLTCLRSRWRHGLIFGKSDGAELQTFTYRWLYNSSIVVYMDLSMHWGGLISFFIDRIIVRLVRRGLFFWF